MKRDSSAKERKKGKKDKALKIYQKNLLAIEIGQSLLTVAYLKKYLNILKI